MFWFCSLFWSEMLSWAPWVFISPAHVSFYFPSLCFCHCILIMFLSCEVNLLTLTELSSAALTWETIHHTWNLKVQQHFKVNPHFPLIVYSTLIYGSAFEQLSWHWAHKTADIFQREYLISHQVCGAFFGSWLLEQRWHRLRVQVSRRRHHYRSRPTGSLGALESVNASERSAHVCMCVCTSSTICITVCVWIQRRTWASPQSSK